MSLSSFSKVLIVTLVASVTIVTTYFPVFSTENIVSPEEIAREQLLDSVSTLSGITNSGVSDIILGDSIIVNTPEELSTYSGITNSGVTQIGSTGVTIPAVEIDYSNYNYYEGLFIQDGVTYGNSLYPKSLDLNPPSSVKVYSYDEYMNKSSGLFDKKSSQANSLSTNTLDGEMMMTALSTPTNGLIAEYLFDGNANDSSGNGSTGITQNVNWVADKFGVPNKAALFNTGSSMNSGSGVIFKPQYVSISFWIKGLTPTGNPSGTMFRFGMYPSYALDIVNYNPRLYIQRNPGCSQSILHEGTMSSVNINPVNWDHVVGTFDGIAIRIYVNGIQTGITNVTLTGSIQHCSGYNFSGGPSNYLDGSFTTANTDNFRLYNRALSPSEILDLYNEGTTPPVSNDTNVPHIPSWFVTNPSSAFSPFDGFAVASNSVTSKQNSDPGKENKDTTNLGDPVNLATGEFAYDNTLMKIPGIGLPYELGITYKNQATYNGPLGFNWDHGYNQYLSVEGNGNVLYNNGKLGTFRFLKSGSIFVRNEGLRATLIQSGGLYAINYDNGNKANFNSINRISKFIDSNNNALNFNYSGAYLSNVVDTLGRTINYSYYNHNRLQTVTDFTGRKVNFVYYTGATASGNTHDLKDIILTNSGVTKKISFEYSSGSTEPQIHNLTKLIDAKGQIYVENTYDTGDRVATQKYGDGTLTYSYTLSGNSITQNTVVDKLGNRSDYTYDANGNHTSIRYYNLAQTGSVLYNYTYSASGFLLTETRPRGNGYKYGYDANGNLIQKRMKASVLTADSAGDIVTSYTYNSRNEKLTETLPNGVVVNYGRDTNGNILTRGYSGVVVNTSNPGLSMTGTYTYYANGLLKSSLSAAGRPIQYSYTNGQVTTLVRGSGFYDTSTGSFSYSPYGTVLTATDGDGYTKTYEYGAFDLVTKQTTASGIITTYDYDANNNKIRETVFLSGGIPVNSYYYYDSLDHLTGSLVDIALGQSVLTSYKYDANGNIIEKKIGNGALIKYKYNEFSKVIEERVIMVPGDVSKDIVTTYAYDTNNNLTSKIDPRGYTTSYIYDLYDRVIQETNPQNTYTSYVYLKDGAVDTKKAYTSTGLILTSQKWLYDNMGHKVQETNYLDPVNTTGAIIKNWTYTQDFDVSQEKESGAQYVNYAYNTRGDPTMTIYRLNNNTQIAYNKRGIKIQDSTTGNSTNWTATDYLIDADGRTIRSTNTLGKYKIYTYNNLNQIIKTVDEVGRVTDIVRDYRGLILTSTSYSGSTAITTTYTYDDRGNMTSITDPMNRTTSYQYDGINRNTKIIYLDLKEMNYTYDKNSNLLTKTDPNGTIVTNTYNSLNQLTNRSISLGSGIGGVTSETYTYDALGRLTSGADSLSGSLVFTYDAMSRLKSETQKPLGGTGYTVGYNYSSAWYSLSGSVVTYLSVGDIGSITLPDGKIQTITHDLLHRPLVTTYSGQTILTNTYTGFLMTSSLRGNGIKTQYLYDSMDRIINITNPTRFTSSYYIYNDASDIISDDIKSYSYDSLARLTTANSSLIGPLSESYSYDKTGNRIKNNISTGVINYTTNNLDQYTLLTGSILSGSITYDNNGNLKINTNRTYIYDYNNRLIQVNIGTGILAKYKYDILGRRTQKIDYSKSSTNPESTLYVYSQNNIISEYRTIGVATGSGGTGVLTPLTLKKNYINGIGTDALIAYEVEEQLTATGLTKTTNRYYYHLNQLGSVVAISTQAGNMPRTFGYDAFGKAYILGEKTITEATYKDISSYTGTLYGNTRLYTGREYDQETGLYYNRARYYNPDTGRFLSRDPIGQNDQINLYTYVANNPLKYVDRMGLEKVLILIGEDFIGGANSILIQETLKIEKSRLFVKGIKDKNIVIKNINSVSGFNDGLNQAYLFKYSGVIGLFHGNRNGISITKNEIIDNNTLKNLSVPSDFDIPIRLDSCDTGFSGLFSDGIAGKLAKTLGTTVSAPNKTLGVDTANSDFIIGDEKYISGKRRGDSDLILSISTSGPGKWNTFNY